MKAFVEARTRLTSLASLAFIAIKFSTPLAVGWRARKRVSAKALVKAGSLLKILPFC